MVFASLRLTPRPRDRSMRRALMFILAISAAFPTLALAQDRGRPAAADFVLLSLSTERKLMFALDRDVDARHRKPLAENLRVLARNETGVNVVLRFLNPLKYTWRVSDTPFQSDQAAATEAFLESANVLLSKLSMIKAESATKGMDQPVNASGISPSAVLPTKLSSLASLRLLSTQRKAMEMVGCNVNASESKRLEELEQTTDRELTWGASAASPDSTLSIVVTRRLRALVDAGSIAALRSASSDMGATAVLIDERTRRAREALVRYRTAMEFYVAPYNDVTPEDRGDAAAAPKLQSERTANFTNAEKLSADDSAELEKLEKLKSALEALKTASENQKKQIDSLVANQKKQNDGLVAAIDAVLRGIDKQKKAECKARAELLLTNVETIADDFESIAASRDDLVRRVRPLADLIGRINVQPEDDEILVAVVKPSEALSRRVAIEIVPRKITISGTGIEAVDESPVSASFDVVLDSRFSAGVGLGVALSNVTFERFGTAIQNGGLTVARSTSGGQQPIPAILLDVTTSSYGPAFGLQLGVGTQSLMPVLMAGASVRLPYTFPVTLSLGALSPVNQTLRTLKVDSPVTSTAELDKDVKYVLGNPRLYFGVKILSK